MEKKYRCTICGNVVSDSDLANDVCSKCNGGYFIEIDDSYNTNLVQEDIASYEDCEELEAVELEGMIENDRNAVLDELEK